MPAKLTDGPRVGHDLSKTSAGLTRGPNQKKTMVAAAWSNTFPAPGATLDLDFANNRGFVRGVGQGGAMDAITFTRASTGQFVNQTGLLESAVSGQPRFDWASTAVVSRNLFGYSQAYESWNLTNVNTPTKTALTSDPFGGNEAYSIVPTTSTSAHRISYPVSVPVGTVFTFSVYAKKNGYSNIVMIPFFGFNAAISIDLNAGTITDAQQFVISSSITLIADNWYRCSVTSTTRFLTANPAIEINPGETNAGNGTSGIFLWGAQFEVGSSATAYQAIAQPTTNTPLLPAATCNGLLIEEARTNRLLWCRDATQTNWTKTSVTAAKNQTGIDGVANAASSLTATADGGTCIQTITLASGSRTGSVYLKRLTGTGTVQVSLDGNTWSTVDLSDTEWRRIVLSGIVTNPTVGVRIAVSGDAVAMDYGQVEDGTSETSPILTTTATATRSSDIATIAEILFDRIANRAEMSFKATFNCRGGSGQRHVFNYSSGSDTGLVLWNANQGARWYWGIQTPPPVLFFDSPFGVETTLAGSYKRANASLGRAGVSTAINREISFGINANLRLSIGCQHGGGANLNGTIKQLVINMFDLNETQVVELSR